MQSKKQIALELLRRASFRIQDALDEVEEMESKTLLEINAGVLFPADHLREAIEMLEEISQQKPSAKIRKNSC